MQVAINKAQRWGAENGLTFGTAKTVVVVFSHARNPTKFFPKLKINGTILEYSDTVKYLGVTLDTKLTFKQHIKNKCKQAIRLLHNLKNAIGKLWGPSLTSMKWIYHLSLIHI